MTQDRSISKIMIGNLMACGFDLSNQLRVAYSPFSDKKERSLRVITCKDFENLRRKNEVRAIVERYVMLGVSFSNTPRNTIGSIQNMNRTIATNTPIRRDTSIFPLETPEIIHDDDGEWNSAWCNCSE
jgi:hypothetical protein